MAKKSFVKQIGTTSTDDLKSCVRLIRGSYTFTQEYNEGEIIDLQAMPANARVVQLSIGTPFNAAITYEVEGQGTAIATLQGRAVASGNQTNAFPVDAPNSLRDIVAGQGPLESRPWYKETVPYTLQFKVGPHPLGNPGPASEGVTGGTIEFYVWYMQE